MFKPEHFSKKFSLFSIQDVFFDIETDLIKIFEKFNNSNRRFSETDAFLRITFLGVNGDHLQILSTKIV